jgi:hypothetical protein
MYHNAYHIFSDPEKKNGPVARAVFGGMAESLFQEPFFGVG